ncbi:uncharacterized protein LOC143671470 isoform X2 [Tamandua tetradactyla]
MHATSPPGYNAMGNHLICLHILQKQKGDICEKMAEGHIVSITQIMVWTSEHQVMPGRNTVLAVKSVIFRPDPYGHLDQQPYIMVWQDLCENPPPWVHQQTIPDEPGPAHSTRSRRAQSPSDVAVTLPLRPYGPPVDDRHGGEMPALQYWPFSSSDLYNWKNNNPPFSEAPTRLAGLVESLIFSHQPTWDDCQQLLGTLFTMEE